MRRGAFEVLASTVFTSNIKRPQNHGRAGAGVMVDIQRDCAKLAVKNCFKVSNMQQRKQHQATCFLLLVAMHLLLVAKQTCYLVLTPW